MPTGRKRLRDWAQVALQHDPIQLNNFSGEISAFSWRETAARSARCRRCDTKIAAGDERIVYLCPRINSFRFRTGGKSTYTKLHFHPGCFLAPLARSGDRVSAPLTEQGHNLAYCLDCQTPVNRMDGEFFSGNTTLWGGRYRVLCDNCAGSARYRMCNWCQVLWPRRYTALIVNDVVDHERWACDVCSDDHGLVTTRTLARQERQQERLQRHVDAMEADVKEWTGGGS